MIGRLWMRAVLVAVAVGLWAVAAWPAVAAAQTTVRQAKLVTTDASGNPLLNDVAVSPIGSGASSRSFDTTAFGSIVVSLTTVSGDCGLVGAVSTYEIPEPYGWARLRWVYNSGVQTLTLVTETAPTQGSAFVTMQAQNASVTYITAQSSCVFDAALTLVPFSTTTIATGLLPDGYRPIITNGVTYPVLVGGVDITDGANPQIHTMRMNSSGYIYVVGNVTPVTPVLATEDPIVPNSITTTETVYSFDGTKRVTLQANGTGYVWCRVTTDNTLVITSSNYTFSLAAASIADNGTGGSITLPYIPASGTYLRCIAGTGTAIVNGFAHP